MKLTVKLSDTVTGETVKLSDTLTGENDCKAVTEQYCDW